MGKNEIVELCALIVAAAFLITTPFSCTTIPAGSVGILTTFGDVDQNTIGEGMTLIKPWKSVVKMSAQTREVKEKTDVPTKKGLTVTLDASLFYHLDSSKASAVYKSIGVDYEKNYVETQFRSAIRDATVRYEAEDLYTANRAAIEAALLEIVDGMLKDRGFIAESVRLRDVTLPEVLSSRITQKLAADQEAQAMVYVLQKAEQEAKRKKVEAQGIADAQTIIKKDLSHEYLVYLWIQALSNHSGATIYIPTGNDGMPFFNQIKGGK